MSTKNLPTEAKELDQGHTGSGRGKDLNSDHETLEPLFHHVSIWSLKRYQVHRGRVIEVGDGVMGWRYMVRKTRKKQQPDRITSGSHCPQEQS